MDTEIRLYPVVDIEYQGKKYIANQYNGWKCFLSEEIYNGEHAPIYLYTVITPHGDIIKNIDLCTANEVIFSEYIWEHYFDGKIHQRVIRPQ